jgi:hypothetical protein
MSLFSTCRTGRIVYHKKPLFYKIEKPYQSFYGHACSFDVSALPRNILQWQVYFTVYLCIRSLGMLGIDLLLLHPICHSLRTIKENKFMVIKNSQIQMHSIEKLADNSKEFERQ